MSTAPALFAALDAAIAGGTGDHSALDGAAFDALTQKEVRRFAKRYARLLNTPAERVPGVDNGRTPLHHLVLTLNGSDDLTPCVDAFLDAGASATIGDAEGRTPLLMHTAECVPSPALVQRLLGAHPAAARRCDARGRGALHLLAANQCAVPHGPDAGSQMTPDGITDEAAVERTAHALVAAGAPGWDVPDAAGQTPRHAAETNPNVLVRRAVLAAADAASSRPSAPREDDADAHETVDPRDDLL